MKASIESFTFSKSSHRPRLFSGVEYFTDRVHEDWDELKASTDLTDQTLATFLQIVSANAGCLFSQTTSSLRIRVHRENSEKIFQRQVVDPLIVGNINADQLPSLFLKFEELGKSYSNLGSLKSRFENLANTVATMEEKYWSLSQFSDNTLRGSTLVTVDSMNPSIQLLSNLIHERYSSTALLSPQQLNESLIWAYRSEISFLNFQQKFAVSSSNSAKFPLIRIFLENEKQLPLIDCLISIFQWHNLLFSVFPNGKLTRLQAESIRNVDVIQMLPLEKKEDAAIILSNYISDFNKVFPYLEYLFECQENPYKNSLVMGEETKIVFSLPSKPAFSGAAATEGIVTVAIAEMLSQKQNVVMDTIFSGLEGLDRRNSAQSISQATSVATLRQQLCNYNRQRDFLPLLYCYSNFSLSGSGSASLDLIDSYDFSRISYALENILLLGKQKILLNLRLYQYAGEIHTAGFLSKFAAAVRQIPLPIGIVASLGKELEQGGGFGTEQKSQFIRILETSIRFLSSAGFMAEMETIGNTSLTDFVILNLGYSSASWESHCPPSARSNLVTLSHLAELHSILEQSFGVAAFSRVDSKYRVKLKSNGVSLVEELQGAIRRGLDKVALANILRSVLNESLSDNNSLDPRIPLRSLLDYVDGIESVSGYQELFPSSIQLAHCLDVYKHFISTS